MIDISTLAQEIMMNSKPRSAFTLLELLIVVAIIAVLAGLVLVGVAMIKEQSRRIACGNNLRSWGLCAIAASTDNQGALLASYYEGMTSSVRPQLVAVADSAWVRNHKHHYFNNGHLDRIKEVHPMAWNQFTIVKAAQYMDGGEQVIEVIAKELGVPARSLRGENLNVMASEYVKDGSYAINQDIRKIDLPIAAFSNWRCPSQRAGFALVPANEMGGEGSRASTYISGMGYSYFARSDQWRFSYGNGLGLAPIKGIMMYTDAAPVLQKDPMVNFDDTRADPDLGPGVNVNGINAVCARTPVGERVLMTETLMADDSSIEGLMGGNDRVVGPNHIKTFGTRDKRGSLHDMTGNYVLMGDGRVVWRAKSHWDIEKMLAARKTGWQVHYLGLVD